jgi:hypothetical protein
MFSILEVLIIVMMPAMVAVHAWAPSHAKTLSSTSGDLAQDVAV